MRRPDEVAIRLDPDKARRGTGHLADVPLHLRRLDLLLHPETPAQRPFLDQSPLQPPGVCLLAKRAVCRHARHADLQARAQALGDRAHHRHQHPDDRDALLLRLGNGARHQPAALHLLRLRAGRSRPPGGSVLAPGRVHLRQPPGQADLRASWRRREHRSPDRELPGAGAAGAPRNGKAAAHLRRDLHGADPPELCRVALPAQGYRPRPRTTQVRNGGGENQRLAADGLRIAAPARSWWSSSSSS